MPSKKEYNKIYREQNAYKIKEQRSQIVICQCGREVSKHHFARHQRSDIHKNLMTPPISTFTLN